MKNPLAAKEQPGIVEKAKSLVAQLQMQAQQEAEAKVAAARASASAGLAAARARAKLITGAVHGYYFNNQKSLSVWAPSQGTQLEKISGNFRPVSDIEVDEENGVLLWSNTYLGAIMTAQLDGGNPCTLYNCTAPQSVAADPNGGAIYWASNFNKIMLGNLQGAPATEYLKLPSGSKYDGVSALKIDAARDENNNLLLFWADGETIYKASSGSDIAPIFHAATSRPVYIALDKVNLLVYWLDMKLQAICSCDFSGGNFKTVLPLDSPQNLRGLRVEPSNGDIYFIYRAAAASSFSLQKYDPQAAAGSQVESIFALGSQALSWGLALHLTATTQALRAALGAKHQAEVTRQASIEKARKAKNAAILAAQQEVSAACEQKTQMLAQVRSAADEEKNAAFKKHDEAENQASEMLKNAGLEKQNTIAEATQKAHREIDDTKAQARENESAAQSRLDAARDALRKLG